MVRSIGLLKKEADFMTQQIQLFLSLLTIIIVGGLISSCSSSSINTRRTAFNPETQEVERHAYTPFYQLKTEILPENLQLSLVTQLHKKTIPGVYSIKEFTRRLLPNDYMAKSNTMLYLQNLTDQSINFDLLSISIEQKHLPFSARSLTISADKAASVPLGEITIDLRLTTLNTRIEYIASGAAIKKEHKEKEFDMLRNFQIIKADDKDKKNPETAQEGTTTLK